VLKDLITVLETRVKALEADAAHLLVEGEVEAANLKTAFATELAALAAELQKILGKI
jgi:hypothetical protein